MKKRILMISPIPSHPQTAGNRMRIYALGNALKKLGHDFYFAHVERETGDPDAMRKWWGGDFFFPLPYTRPKPLWFRIKRKIRSFYDQEAYYKFDLDAWYDNAIDAHLIQLHRNLKFDVVIVEYIYLSKALLCFPEPVLKVIDTHDVLTNRHKAYLEKKIGYNWYSTTETQEKKGLNRADVIVAIQDSERAFFANITNKMTITVGHIVKAKAQEAVKSSLCNILFIGSANQSNIDAIRYFIEDIFPTIKRSVPEATLFVAGRVCRILNDNIEGIEVLGELSDLESIYDKVDVVVNPIRIGTGLKIKNIEALGYSKPLVTTTIGAAGLGSGNYSAFSIADTAKDFAGAVICILSDSVLYRRLSGNGYHLAVNWNKQQMDALRKVLNGISSI